MAISSPRAGRILPVLVFLCMGTATGLDAEIADNSAMPPAPVIHRPLRGIRPEQPLLLPYPPLPAAHYPLLTTEALEQPLTKHYIAEYSSRAGIAQLNPVLHKGGVYLAFIRDEIARRNLPPELLYLPIIESGYQSTARSSSGAMGLWQFMMNSIAPFDMTVNDLIDERRDFQKSTIGALDKLEENYRALGNWPLALAAYNAGLGAVSRAVQQTGIRDYWRLCEDRQLRDETIHYVPRLIAIAHILSRPRRFGVDFWPETFEWAAIPVGKRVSLDIIAAQADINRELLDLLNAELLQGITPADNNYRLKVPAEQVALVYEILELNNSTPVLSFGGTYIVKKGDTLWSLAIRYGIDPQTLARENDMEINHILPEGKVLKVPIME